MANNNNIFNAVMAGAGGANQQRWITDTSAGDYAEYTALIEAIASAVDAAIEPIVGDANTAQSGLMQSICLSIFSGRLVQSMTEANYAPIVEAIVALYSSLNGQLLPPTEPTNGGGLTTVFFVDPGTETPDTDQTGSATNPYGTVEQAIEAANTAGGGTIVLADGDYTGISVGTLATQEDEVYIFQGYGNVQNLAVPNPISGEADIRFESVQLVGTLETNETGPQIVMKNSRLVGDVNAPDSNLQLDDSEITGTIIADGLVTLNQSFVGGNVTLTGELNGKDSQYQGAILSANAVIVERSLFVGPITLTGSVNLNNCQVKATIESSDCFLSYCEAEGNITVTGSFSCQYSQIATDGGVDIQCGSANVVDSVIAGDINANADITIDQPSWGRIVKNGGTITAGTATVLNSQLALQSQLGWTPVSGADSNTFTLLPADHTPGMYEISYTTVVRTTGTTSGGTVVLSWSTPGQGAESKNISPAWTSGSTGTLFIVTNAVNTRAVTIISDGSTAMTLKWNVGTISSGNPVYDIYCSARLLATS